MLFKTKGLVLSYIKYKETSIVVKIFTDYFGVQSYIVNGVRSKKSHSKIALFQSLTLLDLVVYKNDKRDLQRISEIKCLAPYQNIPFDHNKSAVAMFLAEILSKSLSTEENQFELFNFLQNSLLHFDLDISNNRNNFHLYFCLQLAHFYGLSADTKEIIKQVENWLKCTKSELDICTAALKKLENGSIGTETALSSIERKLSLYAITMFLQRNIPALQQLKSLDVIKSVYQ